MNRIVIKLTSHGELDLIASDSPCRIFVLDESCASEPVYEMAHEVGVQFVTKLLSGHLAATGDSIGPWKQTKPVLCEVKND